MAYGFNDDKSKAGIPVNGWTFLEDAGTVTNGGTRSVNANDYYAAYHELAVLFVVKYGSEQSGYNYEVWGEARFGTNQILTEASQTGKIRKIYVHCTGTGNTGMFTITFDEVAERMKLSRTFSGDTYNALIYGIDPKA